MSQYEFVGQLISDSYGIIDINGFKFSVFDATAGTIECIKILVPIFDVVENGDFVKSTKWDVSKINLKDVGIDAMHMVVICNRIEILSAEEYVPLDLLKCNLSGLYIRPTKNYIRKVGTRAKEMYLATIKRINEFDEQYSTMLVGFNGIAHELQSLDNAVVINANVCIKPQLYEKGEFELNVINFNVIKEDLK